MFQKPDLPPIRDEATGEEFDGDGLGVFRGMVFALVPMAAAAVAVVALFVLLT
tara:strand:- start:209 stop:367 length:159 start_codon:yes stop_codon:yes gene_type:complete